MKHTNRRLHVYKSALEKLVEASLSAVSLSLEETRGAYGATYQHMRDITTGTTALDTSVSDLAAKIDMLLSRIHTIESAFANFEHRVDMQQGLRPAQTQQAITVCGIQ